MVAANKVNTRSKIPAQKRGEFFTTHREIHAMVDLVADECTKAESRFFEPACGNGNFLAAILERKLQVVAEKHKSQLDFEQNYLIALSSIYGIDICSENVSESRVRLSKNFREHYNASKQPDWKAHRYFFGVADGLIEKNIIVGDTLNRAQDIVLSQWLFLGGSSVRERGFRYSDLAQAISTPVFVRTLCYRRGLVNYFIECHAVKADADTGEWLGEPVFKGTVRISEWAAKINTDAVHYDFYNCPDEDLEATERSEERAIEITLSKNVRVNYQDRYLNIPTTIVLTMSDAYAEGSRRYGLDSIAGRKHYSDTYAGISYQGDHNVRKIANWSHLPTPTPK